MKVVKIVEKNTETKRRYTKWQGLIEEFHKSKLEVWKMYRPEDSWVDDKTFNNIVNALRNSVKRTGRPITVMKRRNEVYLIKAIKVEYVDFQVQLRGKKLQLLSFFANLTYSIMSYKLNYIFRRTTKNE